MAFVRLCRVDDVAEGSATMVVRDQHTLGVFRAGGRFYALANSCPHAGASLAHGFVDGDTVTCRIHHWRFRLCDGVYLDENLPAKNVATYPVRIEEGWVAVDLP